MLSLRILTALVSLTAAASAQDPCAQWNTGFGPPGLEGTPTLMRSLNIGGSDVLFVSGGLTSAGNQAISGSAYWDGHEWQPGATEFGFAEGLRDLVEFDDGSGLATYVGGRFSTVNGGQHVAVWDGATLFDVGGGIQETVGNAVLFSWVERLVVHDDGSGPALYAAGRWFEIGGQPIQHIARWDGVSWAGVGSPAQFSSGSVIYDMCEFDAGSGPELYVAGSFGTNGSGISRWDGTSWSQVGAGLVNPPAFPTVRRLAVHDDGSGPALYALGTFSAAGGTAVNIARWDGASWSAVGVNGPTGAFDGLYSWGSTLVVAGSNFWDGSTWTTPAEPPIWGIASIATTFDDGSGPALYVGGSFKFAGDLPVASIAKYTGQSYEPLGGGVGAPKVIDALAVFDDGTGPKLAADFRQNTAVTIDGEGVSLYDGSIWTPLGGATSYGRIEALESYDDGAGEALFAGGDFEGIDGAPIPALARWDGSAWGPVGGLFAGRVRGMQKLDDGTGERLFVCGQINKIGGIPMSQIVAWDGSTWADIGSSSSFGKRVNDLVRFDDGTGEALFAGGNFTKAEGVPAGGVARWDGSLWQPVGTGMNDWVHELVVYDDGTGSALYAGGRFTTADGQPAAFISRWDGSSWSAVGAGLPNTVKALEVVDLGFGPVLFAGGQLGGGGFAVSFFEYWDGTSWIPYEAPVTGSAVFAIESWDDPTTFGPDVFVGGNFHRAGGLPAADVAQLSLSCPCETPTYCTAKQNSQGCYPAISTTGTNSLSAGDLKIEAIDVLNNKLGILIWSQGAASTPFQGGVLCVEGPFSRTPVQSSGGNPPPNDCSGTLSFDFDASYAASKGVVAGDVIYAQYWSRDSQAVSGSSLSDGVQLLLCP